MNKRIVLTIVGVVALIVAGYFIYEHFMYVETDNAQIEANTVMLAPKVGGYIVAVNIVEGQSVKKGDVLVRIDERDYQNALTQAKSEVLSVQARMRDAERNYKRLQSLFSSGAVSQQQFDTATSGYNDVKAKYDAASAQVAQAELNLANTQIRAPMDGFIARKSVEQGQLAAPGVPLIGFVGAGERWVTANFKETELKNIQVGKEVDIDVDALPGRDYHGKVESISAATGARFTLLPPDNATGNFTKVVQRVPVRIKMEGLKPEDVTQLKAGLSAVVKVHIR